MSRSFDDPIEAAGDAISIGGPSPQNTRLRMTDLKEQLQALHGKPGQVSSKLQGKRPEGFSENALQRHGQMRHSRGPFGKLRAGSSPQNTRLRMTATRKLQSGHTGQAALLTSILKTSFSRTVPGLTSLCENSKYSVVPNGTTNRFLRYPALEALGYNTSPLRGCSPFRPEAGITRPWPWIQNGLKI